MWFSKPDIETLTIEKNVKGLVKALASDERDIRIKSARALCDLNENDSIEKELGNRKYLKAMISALEYWNRPYTNYDKYLWQVIEMIVKALGELKDSSAVEPLCVTLRNASNDMHQSSAAQSLGKIGDKRAMNLLCDCLKRSNYPLDAIAEAIKKIGMPHDRTISTLCSIALRNTDVLIADLTYVLELLETMIKSNNKSWIISILVALGETGDKRVIKPINDVLRKKDGMCKDFAAHALSRIGGAQAVDLLCAALKDNNCPRAAVAKMLCDLGDARIVEPLCAALKYDDYGLQETIATGLRNFEDSRAVKALCDAVKNASSRYVRWAAARSLIELYKRGSIDETVKKEIIAIKKTITAEHHDLSTDTCPSEHTDFGVGIQFIE